jgi:cell division protein FtsB
MVRSINKFKLVRTKFKQEGIMPRQKTKEELEERIDELEAENEALQDQVDAIQDILEPEEEDEGEA